MFAQDPLTVTVAKTLSEIGVSQDHIRYGHLTMESDLFICVKDTDGGKNVLKIFDLANGYHQDKFPMNGESAIMNPERKWLAIRGGASLQVFDAEQKQKVCSTKLTDEEVVFWTWISPKEIGVVTKTSVFHWQVTMGDSTISKLFELNDKLQGSQIVSYEASSDGQWLVLTGISKEDNEIVGNTQLFSVAKGVSQALASHAATFCNFQKEGETEKRGVFSFVEKKVGSSPRLFIMELDKSRSDPFKLNPVSLEMEEGDFPLSLLFSEEYQCIFMISKGGYFFVFDLETGKQVIKKKVTTETIFASAMTKDQSVLGITVKTGKVLHLRLDKQALVPYLLNNGSTASLAISLATRMNLPGAEQLFHKAFSSAIASSPVEAAKIAATAPNGVLRTEITLNKLKSGGNPALLEYFKHIMGSSKLNEYESLELCKLVISQKKHATIERLIKENKITITERLGDLLMHQKNLTDGTEAKEILRLAVACYMKAESLTDSCKQKVVEGLVQMNESSKIVAYCTKVGFTPNYNNVIESLIKSDHKAAEAFAKQLANDPQSRESVNVDLIVDKLLAQNHIQEATSFLMDFLKRDVAEEAKLQTKLIVMNIEKNQMNVVEAILGNDLLHHFDKTAVAQLLEERQLFQRALGLYNDIPAVKRVLNKLLTKMYSSASGTDPGVHSHEEYIHSFCQRRSKENLIDILSEMIQVYMMTNNSDCLKLVVSICVENVSRLGADESVTFLESKSNQSFDPTESIFLYTSQVINSEFVTKQIVLKLVETGCKLSQFDVVINVIRENELIPAVQGKLRNFLFIEKLSDPRPLIHLCNRLKLVQEMTVYLVQNNLFKHLQIYVEKVNPAEASQVIIKLLDLNTSDDRIKGLLALESVKREMNYEYLVEELESRNKLFFIKDLLEEQVLQHNIQNKVVHNALAKMYILTNNNPEHYLQNYDGYDSTVIGDFAEKIDPKLAFLCYEKSQDEAKIISLCFKNDLFEKLALYCLQREDIDLWTKIFKNEQVEASKVEIFLDTSVSSTALSKAAPELSKISALIKALLPVSFRHLLILLEHLILSTNSTLTDTEKESNLLQNLLFLSATKVKPEKIMSYIQDERLHSYEIGYVTSQLEQAGLKKEAVEVYKKFGKFKEAVEVMLTIEESDDLEATVANWLEHMKSNGNFDDTKEKEVISVIGKHALEKGLIQVAAKYLTQAENVDDYLELIRKGIEFKEHASLIEYLRMCRKKVKDVSIDSTMAYALAMCTRREELQEFIMMPNLTQVSQVGERLLSVFKQTPSEELFECVVILFSHENNHVKLCEIFLAYGDYKRALDAAKKANRVDTWLLVAKASVENGEMLCAKVASLNVITSPENLEIVLKLYINNARIEDLINLLEHAITTLDSVNSSIYTSLAVLYGEYSGYISSVSETKLLDFVTKNVTKLNVARVTKVCEDNFRLKETFEILKLTNELEKALELVFRFGGEVFEHSKIIELLQTQNSQGCIRNEELYYKLLSFYFQHDPLNVSNLLINIQNNYIKDVSPLLDCARIITIANECDNLPLLKEFFIEVRKIFSAYAVNSGYETKGSPVLDYHASVVHEALNELFIEEDDHSSLRESVDEHENFDHLKLAQKLENHPLSQFRSIAAKLYMKKKKYTQAMNICEQDNKFDECLFFAKTSKNKQVCSDLLLKFGKKKNKKYFLALLTLCSELVAPDIVLEVAWKNDWTDLTMPFMITHLRKTTERLEVLEKEMDEILSQNSKQQEEERKKASILNSNSQRLMNSF